MDRLALRIAALLDRTFNGANTTQSLFQFLFGVSIRFITDGVLPIRDHPTNGNGKDLLHLAEQTGQFRFTGAEQAASQEYLPRETVT